jgi:hypothetical protein
MGYFENFVDKPVVGVSGFSFGRHGATIFFLHVASGDSDKNFGRLSEPTHLVYSRGIGSFPQWRIHFIPPKTHR